MQKFDPKKPYSEVQGDSRAAYYQAGKYFGPDKEPISDEDAGKPSSSGSFANQVAAGVAEKLAIENAKRPLTLVDEFNASTNSPADIAAARERAKQRRAAEPEPEPAPEPEPEVHKPSRKERAQLLKGLDIAQLRQLVSEAGMEPATGRGSRQKNTRLLLENTE